MPCVRSSGLAVISIAISLLVAAILVIVVLSLYKGGQGVSEDTLETPIERAKALQCLTQVRSLETEITLFRSENGVFPGNLHAVTSSVSQRQCPVTKNAYLYNAKTGQVNCPDHP